jgi:hypothetical protein
MALNWWQEKTIEHDEAINMLNAQMLTANETITTLQTVVSANITGISTLNTVLADWTNRELLNSDRTIDIDIERFFEVYSETLLNIPSYVGDVNKELVHPSVKYFPNGKWGYKYWMAITPYPSSQSAYENPSILVSQDGISWDAPTGLINPIETKPAGSAYNSDPYIFMSLDGLTMYLVYKVSGDTGNTESIYLKSTTDGINWTSRQIILSTAVASEQNVCPIIFWNGTQWVMYTVDGYPATHVLQYRTCTTLTGTWSSSTVCNISNMPSGKCPWHFEIWKLKNIYLMLIGYGTIGTAGNNGEQTLAISNDGINWISSTKRIAYAYKSTGVLVEDGNITTFKLWIGKSFLWQIYYKEIAFKEQFMKSILESRREYNLDLFSGINGLSPAVFGDNFTRADSATSLGTSSSGLAWTTSSGTLGIAGNKAYVVADTNSKAYVEIGISDFKAGVEFSALGTTTGDESWFLFRYSSSSNYFRFGCSRNSSGNYVLALQTVIGGVVADITITNMTRYLLVANDRLEIECVGNMISLYINGILIGTTINSNFATATKIGLQSAKSNTSWDNMYARRVY